MNHAEYLEACTDVAYYLYDEHKAAYGCKGRHYGLWNSEGEFNSEAWTLVQLCMAADQLSEAIDAQMKIEREAEQRAVVRFERLLDETVANGAQNHETAVRWLRDADTWNRDPSAMEFEYGLPYGWFIDNFPDLTEGGRYNSRWVDHAAIMERHYGEAA